MTESKTITLRTDQVLLLRKLAKEFARELARDPEASPDDARGVKRFGWLVDDILMKGDGWTAFHIERVRHQRLVYHARQNKHLEELLDDPAKEV